MDAHGAATADGGCGGLARSSIAPTGTSGSPIHLASNFYDRARLRDGQGRLDAIEEAELGPVAGLRVLHLQCHFGMDTLTLAQRGAEVVGLDFSVPAIDAARALAKELGLETRARFVEADVYDAPAAIAEPHAFDLVYVTWGAICWLPDMRRWAEVVAHFLKPGGRLYLADGHPAAYVFDDDAAHPDGMPGLFVPYFQDAPLALDDARDYADETARLRNVRTVQWMHPLGETDRRRDRGGPAPRLAQRARPRALAHVPHAGPRRGGPLSLAAAAVAAAGLLPDGDTSDPARLTDGRRAHAAARRRHRRWTMLRQLERKVLWLSSYMIHHANHEVDRGDGLKVGGHQASSASLVTLMTALYFHILRPEDRVAVKPHASPVFHAIQYLLGNQTLDKLQNFRAFGGAQSYPSRTKDTADVDFSTGSVGLGIAETGFCQPGAGLRARQGLEPQLAQGAHDRHHGRCRDRRGQRARGPARILEARPRELLVDHRLQPPEPRLGGLRPAVHEDGRPVREPRLEGGAPQVRQAAAARLRRARRPAPQAVDRRLPQHALLGAGVPGRRGLAAAARARPRHPPRYARHRAPARRCGARPPHDQPRRPRPAGDPGGVRGRADRPARVLHRLHHQGLRPALPGPQGQPFRPDDQGADQRAARARRHQPGRGMGQVRGPRGAAGRGRGVPRQRAVRAKGHAAAEGGACARRSVPHDRGQGPDVHAGGLRPRARRDRAAWRAARRAHRHRPRPM